MPKWSGVHSDACALAPPCAAGGCDETRDVGVYAQNVDVVFDASSVFLSASKELRRLGVVFEPLSRAVFLHSKLVRRHMGSVVCHNDSYYAALNACLFTDGTFVWVPAGVVCPATLSTYFKMTASSRWGQFERTLVVLCARSKALYFEGCNAAKLLAPALHAAVVEVVIGARATAKYATLQNWASSARAGVYNFVTKRAVCAGAGASVVWVQIEIGALLTWKYPSSILLAPASRSEFLSLSVSNGLQRVDTGTKCWHLAPNTCSTVVAKSIALASSLSVFRALCAVRASNCRCNIRCDSLVFGSLCAVRALPVVVVDGWPSSVEYESVTSYVTAMQLEYCRRRGLSEADAVRLVVNGYAHDVVRHLPLEASLEVTRLLFSS